MSLVVGILAFIAAAWRLDKAPDVLTDEILYTRASIRVVGEGSLVWDNGDPIFVHPPLYFLVKGMYLGLTADAASAVQDPGDIFAWVYHARHLNAFLAGLTAVVLYLLGRRLRGSWLGLLWAALFILDPFGVRINRRAMLETMAMLLTLAGMGLILINRGQGLWAGLLFGLAMLTKELTFTAPLAVFLFGLWESRWNRKIDWETLVIAPLVALWIYSLFPIWAWMLDYWERFMEVKETSLLRLLGVIQLSGWNRPGVSLLDFLTRRLIDYGSTYLLLGLGGIATLRLLLGQRHDRNARLLGIWGLVLYPFYAFTTLKGAGNDQFFYFLLVPAILLIGYAGFGSDDRRGFSGAFGFLMFLAPVLYYNLILWGLNYGIGLDNGYQQLTAYVQEHLPASEPLNASGDAIKFQYFFPHRPITEAATPEEAQRLGVRYFVLAPKDIWARYGRMTAEMAAWIQEKGELLFATRGSTYGDIFLYRVDHPGAQPSPTGGYRFYPAAVPGSATLFLSLLVVWIIACIGLALILRAFSHLSLGSGFLRGSSRPRKPVLRILRM